MINDKGILIRNIFYMLSYWFKPLNWVTYQKIQSEKFDNVDDLLASILSKGISYQLKQGLYREYIDISDELSVSRGRIDMNGTIKLNTQRKKRLACEFDELSENNIYNQILKSTSLLLIKSTTISSECKTMLKKNIMFFDNVDNIDLKEVKWKSIKFTKMNKNYEMLINICYFIINDLLLSKNKGDDYLPDILKNFETSKLYEKFILEYYKRHYSEYLDVDALEIKWDTPTLDEYLPAMNTDITLRDKSSSKTLIIDAKYYGKMMQERYEKEKYHSSNMYQIYTYVQNYDKDKNKNVAGMLLYAKTNRGVVPNADLLISGNPMMIQTLDLNKEFSAIAEQLNAIANNYFDLNVTYSPNNQ